MFASYLLAAEPASAVAGLFFRKPGFDGSNGFSGISSCCERMPV